MTPPEPLQLDAISWSELESALGSEGRECRDLIAAASVECPTASVVVDAATRTVAVAIPTGSQGRWLSELWFGLDCEEWELRVVTLGAGSQQVDAGAMWYRDLAAEEAL